MINHRTSGTTLIAKIGSVHDGSFRNALKLIEAAAAAGADPVKFQTHLAEAETLRDAPSPPYFRGQPRFACFQRSAPRAKQAGLRTLEHRHGAARPWTSRLAIALALVRAGSRGRS